MNLLKVIEGTSTVFELIFNLVKFKEFCRIQFNFLEFINF